MSELRIEHFVKSTSQWLASLRESRIAKRSWQFDHQFEKSWARIFDYFLLNESKE